MHKLPEHIPTVATFRGEHPENIYYGSVAVVDKRGKLLAHAGDMRTPMFTRSALKPFQAMPLIAQFADKFDLSDADIRRDSKQLVKCGIVVDVEECIRLLRGHPARDGAVLRVGRGDR